MKKALLFFFSLLYSVALKSQTISQNDTVNLWKMTLGLHFFTKQKVTHNYEPVKGLRIYSKPTYDFALEITRYIKFKKTISSSIGFRLGFLPNDASLKIAENITHDSFPFDTRNRQGLPYIAFKGLANLKLWEKKRYSLIQSLGTAFVLVPHGFSNYNISSISSSGIEVLDYRSKGLYNPNKGVFFSALSETSLICTKNGEKKWTLSLSLEWAPKTVIASDYIFYSNKGELKGTMTRRYQQMGIHYGWFFTLKKKKKTSMFEED